ncbi:MAG: 16S rRNA (uracil(1498)-N(3))-methyltransferase [Ruminococcaceae bacterium]|nr:16S rRNA (uracil(1498)-N(3))-methyltransferase [Oscillospiraceae bacterium]
MPRFFVSDENIEQSSVCITGDDAWHIARSLRMAVGENITVCDAKGIVHECTLVRITDDEVTAKIEQSAPAKTESPVRVTLYQALPKGDKMDYIVQKSVEEGVYAIVPFFSERCVSRPDAKALDKKCARWQRIALEAAKQCGRGIIPKICKPLDFSQMLLAASESALGCFCYEGEGTESIKNILQNAGGVSDISIIVGSEGGFSEKEAAAANESGLCMTALGRRILRAESAPGFALACISYQFEL